LTLDRTAIRQDFLVEAGLDGARLEPLAGDASTRRYDRLHLPNGSTRILMDQPPSVETLPCPPLASPEERIRLGYNASARLAAGRIEAFVAIADWLSAEGFSAPRIDHADAGKGLAVIEDLGDDLIARCTERGEPALPMYEAAVDAQVALHRITPPGILSAPTGDWPLLAYDDLALKTGAGLFLEWWPNFSGMSAFSEDARDSWESLWHPIREGAVARSGVFTHRDYHAENLVWMPGRIGIQRIGLLDFQDALVGHPAWDLLHLLQDARRDVDPALEQAMLERYLSARPELDQDLFLSDYRGLAALNAARILFIFARQVAGFGRPRYTAFMPRTWRYLERNLSDPSLKPVRDWFEHYVPDHGA
jgi:aminoglycoside/choline kinase family phosphotransferase